MKIGRRILISLAVGLVWLVLYSIILWKIPFYVHINNLVLPEGSESITVKVAITDYASVPHVVAQKVFVVDLKEEEIAKYIEEKNGIDLKNRETYRFGAFSYLTWGEDPYAFGCIMDTDACAGKIPDEDWEKSYTVFYTSVHNDKVIEAVFYMAIYSGIAVIILSMVILAIFERRKGAEVLEWKQ